MTDGFGSAASARFFAGIGPCLIRYDADPGTGTLTERQRLTLSLDIQYAWRHPEHPVFYLAISNGGPGKRGDTHQIVACRIDPDSGQISLFGSPCDIEWRSLHISLDRQNAYILAAHNDPSGISIVSVKEDGSLGEIKPHSFPVEFGIFGHQILETPEGGTAILVCRGYDAETGEPERPGALMVYDYYQGDIYPSVTIAPNDGYGFGARHLDFHPTLPVFYVAVERQSEIQVFHYDVGIPGVEAMQSLTAVEGPNTGPARQAVSAIHVHPAGHVVYISNRAYGCVDTDRGSAFPAEENSIAVFSVDAESGLLSSVQHVPTYGNLPRTFSIDPSGRMLVAANSEAGLQAHPDGNIADAPLSLAIFGIAPDGKLTDTGRIEFLERQSLLFWAGFL